MELVLEPLMKPVPAVAVSAGLVFTADALQAGKTVHTANDELLLWVCDNRPSDSGVDDILRVNLNVTLAIPLERGSIGTDNPVSLKAMYFFDFVVRVFVGSSNSSIRHDSGSRGERRRETNGEQANGEQTNGEQVVNSVSRNAVSYPGAGPASRPRVRPGFALNPKPYGNASAPITRDGHARTLPTACAYYAIQRRGAYVMLITLSGACKRAQ